jgi:hypothetical protein
MHSKLMLLSHPSYLRIAVPSANLVPYDWGEAGGVMENVCGFHNFGRTLGFYGSLWLTVIDCVPG